MITNFDISLVNFDNDSLPSSSYISSSQGEPSNQHFTKSINAVMDARWFWFDKTINNLGDVEVGPFYDYGIGYGGSIPISSFLWARYFGRRHIGAIRGVGQPITLLFSTSGPIATGAFFDVTGSYVGAFLILAFVYLLGAIVVNLSNVPRPVTLPSTSGGP